MSEPVLHCPPDLLAPCGTNTLQEYAVVEGCEETVEIVFLDAGEGVSDLGSSNIVTSGLDFTATETSDLCGPITDVNVEVLPRSVGTIPDNTYFSADIMYDGKLVSLARDLLLPLTPTPSNKTWQLIFTDSAAQPIGDSAPIKNGIFRPSTAFNAMECEGSSAADVGLSTFIGSPSNGVWTLKTCLVTSGVEEPSYDITMQFKVSVTTMCGRTFTRFWRALGCGLSNSPCEQNITIEEAPEPKITGITPNYQVLCSNGIQNAELDYLNWRTSVQAGLHISNHDGQDEVFLFKYVPEVHDPFEKPPPQKLDGACKDEFSATDLGFFAPALMGNIVDIGGNAVYLLTATDSPHLVYFDFVVTAESRLCISRMVANYYLTGLTGESVTVPVVIFADDVPVSQLDLEDQPDPSGHGVEFILSNSACGGYVINGSSESPVAVRFRLHVDFSGLVETNPPGFAFGLSDGGDGVVGLQVYGMCDCVSPCCYIDNTETDNVSVEFSSIPNPLPEKIDFSTCPMYTATYTIRTPCTCPGDQPRVITSKFTFLNDTFALYTPPDVSLSCTQSTDENPDGPPGQASVTSCLSTSLVVEEDIVRGDCSAQYSILRTWNAFDACGNQKTGTQIIDVRDDTLAITAPLDVTIRCTQSTTPTITGTPTLTDACISPEELSYTYADETSVVCEGAVYQITRTFTASNGCSLTEPRTATQHISVIDDTLAITAPVDVTISCTQTTEPVLTGTPTVTDECVGPEGLTTTFEDQVSVQCAGAIYDIERTWTAANVCAGVTRSDTQHIHVEDNTLVITVPEDATLPCTADTSPHGPAGRATASDACTSVKVTYHDTLVTADVECPVLYQIRRAWTATNACGQTKEGEQVITVTNVGRLRICCPPDVVLAYADSSDPIFTGEPSVFHPCACLLPPKVYFPIAVAYTDSPPRCVEHLPPSHNGCAEYFVRTWTATDRCGESVSCTQRITRLCNAPPLVECPPDVTVAVDAYPPPPAALNARCGCHLTAPDCGCRDNDINVTSSLHVLSTYECVKGHPVRHAQRIYEAEDNCGNKTRCVQNIYVPDAHASATKKRFPDCKRDQ